MRLIFVGQGYPRKSFNLEHFPIYGILILIPICAMCHYYSNLRVTRNLVTEESHDTIS